MKVLNSLTVLVPCKSSNKNFTKIGYNIHRSSQLEELIFFFRSIFQTVATLCADIVNSLFEFIHKMLQIQSLVMRMKLNSRLKLNNIYV